MASNTVITRMYPSLKQIVVLASKENMQKIRQLIYQFDKSTKVEGQ